MAKKKPNLKIVRPDLDETLSQLILLLEGSGGGVDDIAVMSQVGDVAPRTKKGGRSKRGRKARIPKGDPLSALEELAEAVRRGRNVPADLERRALEELPESIKGPLKSEVLIPQEQSARNQRLLKQAFLRDAPRASEVVGGTNLEKLAQARNLSQKDMLAIEQDFIQELVDSGLDETAAKKRVEDLREQFAVEQRQRREIPRPVPESEKVHKSADLIGKKEVPAIGTFETDETGRRQQRVADLKKRGSFRIVDQGNYSEFVFTPQTGKAANAFEITRRNVKTGKPLKFTKDSLNRLSKAVGKTVLAQDGGTAVRYIGAASLFDKARLNPRLGALLSSPEFLSAFGRTDKQTKTALERLRKQYRETSVSPEASEEMQNMAEAKRRRLVREANKVKDKPVVKGKSPKQIQEAASQYAKEREALELRQRLLSKGRTPRIRSIKSLPLLAIAAALKGSK